MTPYSPLPPITLTFEECKPKIVHAMGKTILLTNAKRTVLLPTKISVFPVNASRKDGCLDLKLLSIEEQLNKARITTWIPLLFISNN